MKDNIDFYAENGELLRKEVDRIYPIFKTILETSGKNAVVESAFATIDGMQKHIGFEDKITCTTSECSWCCHEKILMSPLEKDYIQKRVKEHKVKPDKRRSKLQNNATDFNQIKFADKACPFLSSNDGKGKCTIYGIRPFICRTHNSTEFALKCNKELYPNQFIREAKIVEVEAIALVLMMLSQDLTTDRKIDLVPIHKIF